MTESREERLRCRMRWSQTKRRSQNKLSRWSLCCWKRFSIQAALVNIMSAFLPEAFTTCSYFPFQRIQIRITRAISAHQMATAEWLIHLEGTGPIICEHVTIRRQAARRSVRDLKQQTYRNLRVAKNSQLLRMRQCWNKPPIQPPHISLGFDSEQQNDMKAA